MNPLFSVIVNAYNIGEFIDEALNSLQSQSFTNFEIVLVDDGSTDDTSAKLEEFACRHQRVLLLNKGHHGLLLARRLGLAHARGSYILFLDGDDWLHPRALERCALVIEQTNADIVAYRYSRDESLSQAEGPFGVSPGLYFSKNYQEARRLLCQGRMVSIWGKAIRRSCIDIDADYSSYMGLTQAEDFFQVLPIFDAACSFVLIPDVLHFYRRNQNSVTSHFRFGMIRDIETVGRRLRTYAALWGDACRESSLVGEASLYLYVLEIAFSGEDRHQALKAFSLMRSTMMRNGALERMRGVPLPLKCRPIRFYLLHDCPRALGLLYGFLRCFKQQLSWISQHMRVLFPSIIDGDVSSERPNGQRSGARSAD